MARLKLLVSTPKNKDQERAVLPTILFTRRSENWGDVKGWGFGLIIGWWAWGIGFSYVTSSATQPLKGDDK